ncbi:MAG TPA: methyltransferase domain-containing protein [Verrucomicrobiae bacterium]|nr:methyltransferase domain-containing protein [Verrucomicrobiae bacterium]
MFLSQRATQAEYFDDRERSPAEISDFFSALARTNRLFAFAEPFQQLLPRLLGAKSCRSLSLLDLGAGDGSLGKFLTKWAARQNWDWRFTNLDISPKALRLNQSGRNVIGSVLALPFADASFDVVIASQMTHHLSTEEEVSRHFRETWRVSRSALLMTDLHRNVFLYGMLWLLFRLQHYPKHFCDDGLLSVRRGWLVRELRPLVERAGLSDARLWLRFGTRIILQARKPVSTASDFSGEAHLAAPATTNETSERCQPADEFYSVRSDK